MGSVFLSLALSNLRDCFRGEILERSDEGQCLGLSKSKKKRGHDMCSCSKAIPQERVPILMWRVRATSG